MWKLIRHSLIVSPARHAILIVFGSALLCALAPAPAAAQQSQAATSASQTVVRDPQALSLIASSLKALTESVAIHDATLQASANYVAGSDNETGTATLLALGNQQSIVQLNLSGGLRQEIRNGVAGAWIGTTQATAIHNCWTDASWFFPALTLAGIYTNAQVSASYLGPDTSKGASLLHVQVARLVPGQSAKTTTLIQTLSTRDIYFDPQSSLPLYLDFNTHPDKDANLNLPVEIVFGNFQTSSGWLVPLHIQKFVQRTLLLDLTLSNVRVNTGVPASAFALPPSTGGGQ
jgi:hypothetical protein